MATKYGYTSAAWNMAKAEMRQILVATAKAESLISYGDLALQIQAIHLEPDAYAMAALLGEISTEENAAGRGMLSVLVVHKDDDMPGQGFFILADELGRDTSDPLKLWMTELKNVYAYWRGN